MADNDEPPLSARRPRKVKVELPVDPEKEGCFWCGICQVSLKPTKAASHLSTARHDANTQKALVAAMRGVRIVE
jgi:hypothetical protein